MIWWFLIPTDFIKNHDHIIPCFVLRLQVPEMDVLVLKAMQDLGVHPNLLAVSLGWVWCAKVTIPLGS